MEASTGWELRNTDSDDIEDLLLEVERSLNVKFSNSDFKCVKTFGELCSVIKNKVEGIESNDCTTQQAFYKLREAFARALLVDKLSITTDSQLEILFPKKERRRQIKDAETILGFELDVLSPKDWITTVLAFSLLSSIIGLAINWKIAIVALALSLLGMCLAYKLGKEFKSSTVGKLAERISREKYTASRRNSSTINKNEIEQKVKELFKHRLSLEDSELTKEAALF